MSNWFNISLCSLVRGHVMYHRWVTHLKVKVVLEVKGCNYLVSLSTFTEMFSTLTIVEAYIIHDQTLTLTHLHTHPHTSRHMPSQNVAFSLPAEAIVINFISSFNLSWNHSFPFCHLRCFSNNNCHCLSKPVSPLCMQILSYQIFVMESFQRTFQN